MTRTNTDSQRVEGDFAASSERKPTPAPPARFSDQTDHSEIGQQPAQPDGGNGADPATSMKKRARGQFAALVIIGMAVGAGAVVYYLRAVAPYEFTDNAFIEGDVTPISAQVAGRVARLCVQDNQEVEQGDTLLEIDPRDFDARLEQMGAALESAKGRLEQANAQFAVDQAKADQEKAGVTAAEAEASRAEADLRRFQAVETRAVSRSQLDLSETQARSAVALAEVARNKALAAQAQVRLTKASMRTAAANVRQAEAELRQAELNQSYTRILAPRDGRVTRRSVEPGAFVQPGQALLAIVPRQLWVVANFKETQLARMRVGQPVEIAVDAYPGRRLKGRIQSFQTGAGARFSLFPPENATGNYIKVVQRVPVKIVFETGPDTGLVLGPGMSVEPKVLVR